MKSSFSAAILLALVSTTAFADDIRYLEVAHTSGAVSDIEVNTLRRITFTGTDMVVTTVDGQQQTFLLDNLSRLFFSAEATPVENVKGNTQAVEVYDLNGRRLTTQRLPRGIYIVKDADGKARVESRE